MVENMKQVIQPWRANVKEGLLYTFSLKTVMMHVYVTYNDTNKSFLLSVEKPIYAKNGQMIGIAILHLTDEDLDGMPDRALYACHFLNSGRLQTSMNIPSEAPTDKDLEAWHAWLSIMIEELEDHVSKIDLYDPDADA